MPIDKNSTVLVTGATGFVGRALVHKLSTLNCHIKVLAREDSMAETLAGNYQAEWIHGDILSKTTVQAACAGTSHIFHLAGRGQNNTAAKSADETRRVNVEGTKVLARAAADVPELQRFLHLSTVAVHGNIADGPADETAEFSAESPYEVTKLAAELWLKDFAETHRLPLTVLRPCAIVGPGDQHLLKLFKLGNRKLIPLVGDGGNRYQIIHVDDCIRAMLKAAEARTAVSETYICGNSTTLTLREVLEIIYRAGNSGSPRVVTLPMNVAKAILQGTEKLCTTLGMESPVSANRLGFFEHSHWFDTAKMQKDLEIELEYSNETALQTTRDWYAKHHWL